MGKLSDIYSAYKASLDVAQDDYEQSARGRSEAASEFYDLFFRDLTVNMGGRLENEGFRRKVLERIERFFGKLDLDFMAVDGSCHRHASGEFVSFYGGAYGARGTLSLAQEPPGAEYKRWEIEKDVSMAAFVPVPYSRMTELEPRPGDDPNFAASESDRIEVAGMHLHMMNLAEVFLAYNSATGPSAESPDLILLDNSPSSMLGHADLGPDMVQMVGHLMGDGRVLEAADVVVAQAHPFNAALGVPSTKDLTLRFAVIRYLHENPGVRQVPTDELESALGPDARGKLKGAIASMSRHGIADLNSTGGDLLVRTDPRQSWEKTKSAFRSICRGMFLDKEPDSLKYRATDGDGNPTMRWMSPGDVQFLIGVGLRALIEACWERKILLAGIVKDSASAYLTRNYLGVCRHMGLYPLLAEKRFGALPPTDRMFCEILPYLDGSLKSPWGTIEFDSAFMTLHAGRSRGNPEAAEAVGGVHGRITRPERLFLRSIAQFYTRQNADGVLAGHAIFVDRLAFAELDSGPYAERLEIRNDTLGHVSPLVYPTAGHVNVGQAMTYFVLDTVTKNHFAGMIGYPDPLHKADQGAKSMRDSVRRLLESSELRFRSRPLTNTLREMRRSASKGR